MSSDPVVFSRRQFLQALAAAGAVLAVPATLLAKASPEVIETAWRRALADPWYFEVGEFGTINEADAPELTQRSDIWDVWDRQPRDSEHLIGEIEQIGPLESHFEDYADDFNEARPEFIAARDWRAWIRHEGRAGLDEFWAVVEQWLDAPIDWSEYEYMPREAFAMGRAYNFFSSMDRDLRRELGVVIVEGSCPGSDYFAAELRQPIVMANAAAERLELPFRFRAEAPIAPAVRS